MWKTGLEEEAAKQAECFVSSDIDNGDIQASAFDISVEGVVDYATPYNSGRS